MNFRTLLILAAAVSTPALAQGTYYTNTDNENNSNTHVADNDMDVSLGNASGIHPIEFNINVTTLPASSAVLTMRNLDVDEEQGEVDLVYINGHLLGKLTGADNVWSSTAFNVDPAWLVQGQNLVRIAVDTSGDATAWVTTSDWGQLLIDGGGAVNGDTQGVQITGTTVNAGTVTINTSTFVHSVTGGTYRLQISLIDPASNAVTVLSQDFAVAAGADSTRNVNPTYPLNSVSGTYTVQAQLFWLNPAQGNFPVQQDIATAQFTHTVGVGASNFNNDSDGDGLLNDAETTLGTDPDDADTDGDGAADGAEVGPNPASPVDTDGDGVINALESSVTDSDSDGVTNQLDPANTNPCVPSSAHAACLGYDGDSDGLTNAQEDALGTDRSNPDTDGDGANDGAEPGDTDGDGPPDALESSLTDTDGDGVTNQLDAANNNPCVPNANSTPCLALDSDGDGLTNAQEDQVGTDRGNADTDGDGANDGAEAGGNVNAPLDTDGDGASNALESSVTDTDGDGVVNQNDFANANPCVPNVNSAACLALDSDGDGLTNAQEDALGTSRSNPDTDGDGAADGAEAGDTDGDGAPNALESSVTDSDNDGTPDQADAANNNPCVPNSSNAGCLATDSDGDGLTNAQEDAVGSDRDNPDTDGDGFNDGAEVGGNVNAPLNTDGDGTPNVLESALTDTDSDGVVNQNDFNNSNPCVPNANHAACLAADSDGDGLTNAQEDASGTSRDDPDTDGDGASDSAETGDSDSDGTPNALESSVTDSDSDGTPNQADAANSNPCVPNSSNAACLAADSDGDGLTNGQEDAAGTDRNDADTDNDGVSDGAEAGANPASPTDSDGDGIPDASEAGDRDGDGQADSADTDSDNDGIADAVEAGADPLHPVDSDLDGTPDYLDRDSDGDGLPDALEGAAGYLNLDSDGDTLPDTLEGTAAGADQDGDGIDDAFDVDTLGDGDINGDGVGDSATLRDTDGDGAADHLDVDSDDDGILDSYEGTPLALTDTDADGVPDLRDLDSDDDGRSDVREAGLVDFNSDSMMDAGQTRTGNPPDMDGDAVPDFRDLDANGDGIFDNTTSGFASLDANGNGRIDAGTDSDEDGIRDAADAAPQVFGTFADGDGDGVSDTRDLDLDNDGIPNAADGSEDTDGDGLPNLADLDADGDGVADLVEAGGADTNGDGLADNFVDVNGNGLADSRDTTLGGSALPLPDADGDGADDHRDLDSDGDGISDVIESRGTDANNDGRQDGTDTNRDGLVDGVDGSLTNGTPLARPDTDGDGMIDALDTDSDNDKIPDSAEGRLDSDQDGVPDSLDASGKLETAVRGTGAFDPATVLGLLGALALVAMRRMRRAVPAAACVVLGATSLGAQAAEPPAKGWFVGFDVGMSMVEPRNPDGGYKIDDKQGLGFRVDLGYSWNSAWSAEVFYADGGEAGIASDNPNVGHLGDISYTMIGAGIEWVPLDEGRNAAWFPLVKLGAVQITNDASSEQINYEKLNDLGLYLGAGLGLRLGDSWTALAEAVSYDQDELFFTVGARKRF